MKNLAELKAIQDKTQSEISKYSMRVFVGMATCGIAAGAKPIVEAFEQAVKENNLSSVEVVRVGCVGLCQYEPLVEIVNSNGEIVTYVNMDADKAKEVAESHLLKGEILEKYTVSSTSLN